MEDGLAGVLEGWIADIEVDLDGEDGDTEYLTGADVVLAGVERVDGWDRGAEGRDGRGKLVDEVVLEKNKKRVQ